jgi:hypothetical protein
MVNSDSSLTKKQQNEIERSLNSFPSKWDSRPLVEKENKILDYSEVCQDLILEGLYPKGLSDRNPRKKYASEKNSKKMVIRKRSEMAPRIKCKLLRQRILEL